MSSPSQYMEDPRVIELVLDFPDSKYEITERLVEKFVLDSGSLKKALPRMRKMLEWRAEVCADSAMSWSFDVDVMKEHYPHKYCGYTKEGHPVYIERLGLLDLESLLKVVDVDSFTKYHILHWEFVHGVLFPQASKKFGKEIDQLVTIVDMTGMGTSLFNVSALSVLSRIAEMDQECYPESSRKLYIVNVPWLFKAAWKILSPMLNARGRGKIEVLRGDCESVLADIVDRENLPDFLGGDLDWETSPEDNQWREMIRRNLSHFLTAFRPTVAVAKSHNQTHVALQRLTGPFPIGHPPCLETMMDVFDILSTPEVLFSVFVLLASIFIHKLTARQMQDEPVFPVILGMATGNPPYVVPQTAAVRIAQSAQNTPKVLPILERVYKNSRINNRHLAVPDFTPEKVLPGDDMFFPEDGSFTIPVEKRLDKFREVAEPLVERVAREAIEKSGVDVKDIGKIVVVSSTGFLGPGLDCYLIDTLGLGRDTDRSLIGFMGCAAAMNGFRTSNDYVRNHPHKYALLVCVEISSVHTTFEDNVNHAILHAIFADGCASAVIGTTTKSRAPAGTLAIVDDYSWLCQNTETGITLDINTNGISCTLSKHLSTHIKDNIGFYVDSFLGRHNLTKDNVDFWCVHPGGTRIIEACEGALGLNSDQTADSWAVLGEYGNMLSPSVMYVFERVLQRHSKARAMGEKGYTCGLAFSFSPGIGVEGLMFRQL